MYTYLPEIDPMQGWYSTVQGPEYKVNQSVNGFLIKNLKDGGEKSTFNAFTVTPIDPSNFLSA